MRARFNPLVPLFVGVAAIPAFNTLCNPWVNPLAVPGIGPDFLGNVCYTIRHDHQIAGSEALFAAGLLATTATAAYVYHKPIAKLLVQTADFACEKTGLKWIGKKALATAQSARDNGYSLARRLGVFRTSPNAPTTDVPSQEVKQTPAPGPGKTP